MAVDLDPDLTSLAPYVMTRVREIHTENPQALKELKAKFTEEFEKVADLKAALNTSERVGWWLHHCGEYRLNKLRYSHKKPKQKQAPR
tara:strand:- start:1743 stop:2006 length:264 start_codon:yes stop_codon:yes gene_type:complete